MRQRRTAVFLLALAALIGGLLTGRALFFNLTYLLALLLIVSFVWAWTNINFVHISRQTRTRRTQVGRPLEERFTVRNTSILPKLWLEIRDFSTLPEHYASNVITSLGPRSDTTWRINTICQQRGRFQLGPIRLTTSDPFGLFPLQRELSPTTHVVVFPPTFDIYNFSLPMGILPGGEALRRRTHHITTNASGVRDYEPGDSFSRIHWRSTARRDRLVVKEFELDPLADIWIVADMALASHTAPRPPQQNAKRSDTLPALMRVLRTEDIKLPETTEEYTVTIAASLAQYFLRYDRAVGLLVYGQSNEIVQPDRGERQLNRVLETLAVLRAEGQVPIDGVVNAESHLFPRGTTVIVVSPTTRDRWTSTARQLRRRGLRVVSVLIDPESFGGTFSNAGLVTMMQANGMMTYDIKAGDDLTAVLSQNTAGGPRTVTLKQ